MFNPAEFTMDAFFQRPMPGATWRNVLQAFVDLSDSDRTSLLEEIRNTPTPDAIPKTITEFLVYYLEEPCRAQRMMQANDEGLIDLSSLSISADGEEVGSDDQALLA